MKQRTINIIIISLIVIALAIGVVALIQANKPTPPVYPGGPPGPPPGLGGAFANILGQVLKGDWWKNLLKGKDCDSDRPGYNKYGVLDPACGGGAAAYANCDPGRPGYNKNGLLDPSCGGGTGSCNPFECDPNNLGKNMCGDAGYPCNCGSGTPQALC